MKRGGSIFAAALAALIVVRVAAMLVAPVFEPSEARYAAISANMARTGDWFVPSFTYKGVYVDRKAEVSQNPVTHKRKAQAPTG